MGAAREYLSPRSFVGRTIGLRKALVRLAIIEQIQAIGD